MRYTVILASSGGNSSNKGIYFSIDNGENWYQTNQEIGKFNGFIELDDKILVGSQKRGDISGMYHSIDGGLTWQPYTMINKDTGSVIDQSNMSFYNFVIYNDEIHVSGGSSHHSDDGGSTWKIYHGLINGSDSSGFYIYDNKLFTTSSSGTGEHRRVNGGGHLSRFGYRIAELGNIVVAGANVNSGIKYSSDGGNTWVYTNQDTGNVILSIYAIKTITTINGGRIFASGLTGYPGICYSDDGITFYTTNMTNSIDAGSDFLLCENNRIISTGYFGGIRYSDDNGENWQPSYVHVKSEFSYLIKIKVDQTTYDNYNNLIPPED